MDLVQTVRKEGSRGGVNFSWDDVKSSQHRENYLGHSLMAPVGRWQQGKDLNWYAKAEDAELTPEQRAERDREAKREELRKIKEAEEDAMARALGLPVPDRSNANEVPLGESRVSQKDLNKALKETLDGDNAEEEQGIGHRSGHGRRHSRERGEGDSKKQSLRHERRRDRSRSRDRRSRHQRDPRDHRARSRSDSRHRHHHRRHRHRDRPRSREREDRHSKDHGSGRPTRERHFSGRRSRSPDRRNADRRRRSRSRS